MEKNKEKGSILILDTKTRMEIYAIDKIVNLLKFLLLFISLFMIFLNLFNK